MGCIHSLCFNNNLKLYKNITIATTVCCFVLAIILTSIILLGMNVNKKIDQSEVAIFINNYTANIRGPFEQGTYTTYPGDTIVIFQRVYQQQDYTSISCLTKDQLSIQLSISYQFQYDIQNIIPVIIQKFNTESFYLDFVSNVFWESYTDVCSNYNAEDYYTNRSLIEATIYDNFLGAVNNLSLGMDIKALQLTHVDFPCQFSDIITNKQITTQNIITNTNARQGLLTQAQTNLLTAMQQARINLITANNTAAVNIFNADTNYAVVYNKWDQYGIGLKFVLDTFNGNLTSFFNYLEYNILQNSVNPIINFGDFVSSV